jgi:peptide deformylase
MNANVAEPLAILLRGDARLEQRCAAVERAEVGGEELRVAAARMHATLNAFRARSGYGRALAAPQVGVMRRVVVMNLRDAPPAGMGAAPPAGIGAGPFTLVNPEFTWMSGEWIEVWDDCLSIPDVVVRVRRRASVTVRFRDLEWREHTWERVPADVAELLQHEVDHLDGVLMTARAYGDDAVRPISERDALVGAARSARGRGGAD